MKALTDIFVLDSTFSALHGRHLLVFLF